MRFLKSFATLGAYLLAAIAFTWPLAARADSAYVFGAASMDTLHISWALAHGTQALISDPSMFLGGNIFHPSDNTFFLGPVALSGIPLFAPTYILSRNPILALNVLYLASLALTAAGIHFVVLRWTGSLAAAIVGGTLFITNPWMLGMAATIPHYSLLFFLPWIILLASGNLERRSEVFGLGLLLAAQCTADPVYLAVPVLAASGLYAAGRLTRPPTRAAGRRLLVAIALGSLLALPVLLLHLRAAGPIGELAMATTWQGEILAIDILYSAFGRLSPRSIHPALGIFFVMGLVALAKPEAAGKLSARERSAFLFATLLFLTGFIGAQERLSRLGEFEFRTPLAFLSDWSAAVAGIRGNFRIGVVCIVSGSILCGLGVSAASKRLQSWCPWRQPAITRAALGTLALVLILVPRGPYLLRPTRLKVAPSTSPLLVSQLHDHEGALAVAPIGRVGFDNSMYNNAVAMYQSTYHWRPILNGYASYYPPSFERRLELMSRIPDPEAIRSLVEEANMTAIWRRPRPNTTGEDGRWWKAMEEDENSQFYLAGWDWQTGERLYRLRTE